jgi:hypothetical protein
MRQYGNWLSNVAALAAGLAVVNSAVAETTISTFDNFNLDGLFPSWSSGAVVSLPTSYSITASRFGSGYKAINPNIDATGETNIELTVTQQFTLTWASIPGKNYTIVYTSDLSGSFSPLLTGITSGGSSTTSTVTIPSGQTGFLRVQQQ